MIYSLSGAVLMAGGVLIVLAWASDGVQAIEDGSWIALAMAIGYIIGGVLLFSAPAMLGGV